MNTLHKIQLISLTNKVISELENHIGIKDKDLAEFVIDLAFKADSVDAFQASLKAHDADFNEGLASAVHKLTHKMHPSKMAQPASTKAQLFPGLAIPNTAPVPIEVKKEPGVEEYVWV
jgi:ATP-dependent RNA helicase DHX8/PRP22